MIQNFLLSTINSFSYSKTNTILIQKLYEFKLVEIEPQLGTDNIYKILELSLNNPNINKNTLTLGLEAFQHELQLTYKTKQRDINQFTRYTILVALSSFILCSAFLISNLENNLFFVGITFTLSIIAIISLLWTVKANYIEVSQLAEDLNQVAFMDAIVSQKLINEVPLKKNETEKTEDIVADKSKNSNDIFIKFWDKVANDIELQYKRYNRSLNKWVKREVIVFLDDMELELEKISKHDKTKALILGRGNKKCISYHTFRNIFLIRESLGNSYTRLIFALYLGYDSVEDYIRKNEIIED